MRLALLVTFPLACCLLHPLAAQTKPIAHYALQSDLLDSAGTNHGTFEGIGGANSTATFVPDSTFGSVLSFDGVDDRINLGNVHTLQNSSWTLSLWVKTTDTSTVGLVGKNNGDTGFSRGERVFEITGPHSWNGLGANVAPGNFAVNAHTMGGVAARGTECGVDVELNDGHWHMIIAMHDETVNDQHLAFYIDGVLVTSATGLFKNNDFPDVGSFYLGFSNWSANGGVDYLKGEMAEVNFFANVLTPLDLLILHSPFARSLASDTVEISVANGGSQVLHIDGGGCQANQNYWMFGSITGTSPGTLVGGVLVPLNVDPYTTLLMGLVNTPVFATFRGVLDGAGSGAATLNVPAAQPIPIGTKLHHACIFYDANGFLRDATDAVQVEFVR